MITAEGTLPPENLTVNPHLPLDNRRVLCDPARAMDVTYSADVELVDSKLTAIAKGRGAEGVRIRVQPAILSDSGNYVAWSGVSWMVTTRSPEEAIELRDALRLFFAQVQRHEVASVKLVLEALQ